MSRRITPASFSGRISATCFRHSRECAGINFPSSTKSRHGDFQLRTASVHDPCCVLGQEKASAWKSCQEGALAVDGANRVYRRRLPRTDEGSMTDAAPDIPGFDFGKNWADFVDKHFSEERVRIAQEHLLGFLRLPDLTGKRMVDIGCGSGLHSLAALRANAGELVSFDYSADAVATTRRLHALSGSPAHWHIEQGSVLDQPYMAGLGKFDLVYSWGVLHHTGDQWTALRHAAECVAPSGVLYVALYTSDVFVDPPAEYWLTVKRRYNRSAWSGKRAIEAWYIAGQFYNLLRQHQNPLAYVWG